MKATFDLNRLDAAPVRWDGETYSQMSMPPDSVVRQMLWELFEVNFRFELDRICHTTTASLGEREQLVLGTVFLCEETLLTGSTRL
ncbi:hypothetical protein V5O48_018170 [Marasmius crinis-equi]|uniref:Uncharacterized protein n=1 Tax=Marasmius crinis-equi TaxID=585013 RepID=A0ABR3EM25_9AGAR